MWGEEIDKEACHNEAADEEDSEEPHDGTAHETATLLPKGHHVGV